MLILTRKEGESLYLSLDPETPPNLTAHELFAAGPIIVTLTELRDSGGVRIGISAASEIVVLREELIPFADNMNVAS